MLSTTCNKNPEICNLVSKRNFEKFESISLPWEKSAVGASAKRRKAGGRAGTCVWEGVSKRGEQSGGLPSLSLTPLRPLSSSETPQGGAQSAGALFPKRRTLFPHSSRGRTLSPPQPHSAGQSAEGLALVVVWGGGWSLNFSRVHLGISSSQLHSIQAELISPSD